MDFTGTGNSLNMLHPRTIQLIMDSLRYWVARDARRRLPLRPRAGARARAVRGRPPRRVLRHHPPGSRALAGQADRRAVGRRARRLPGRQLPGRLGGVERQVPRLRAPLLAGRPGPAARARVAALGLERPVRGERARPYASVNFVTAHDGFTLHDLVSYEQKHNEANGEDNRDGTDDNHQPQLGRRGRDDARVGADDARADAAQPARDARSSRRACP